MDPTSDPTSDVYQKPSLFTELVVAFIFATVLFGIVMALAYPEFTPSSEALHRTRVARDLLDGSSRGRQGLVGSLQVAPLPTVVISLVSAGLYAAPAPWVSILVAAGFTLFLCLYTNRLWGRAGITACIRYPAVLSLLCIPPVALSITGGQTTMLFVGLVVTALAFWLHWLDRLDLRDLAYAGLLLGAGVAVRYQTIYIALAALLVGLLIVAIRKSRHGLIEGTTLTFATPAAYVGLLWIGGNWLILGNPWFFLEGAIESITGNLDSWKTLLMNSCEWTTLACVATLVLSVPLAKTCFRARRGGIIIHLFASAGLFGALIWGASLQPASIQQLPDHRIDRAIWHLENRYPNGSFIVTGYQGYEFSRAAAPDPERAWIHMMHLEESKLRQILSDFQGRRIFILVETAPDMDKWQRLGLEWQGPESRIPDRFLYADTVGSWVVFEVLRESI